MMIWIERQKNFYEYYKLQGVFFQRDEEMRLLTGVFEDFGGPQRLLWDPKDGRKLLLGTEDTFMG